MALLSALIGGGLALGGSILGADAVGDAADDARDFALRSQNLQQELFNLIRQDEAIPRAVRDAALLNVSGLLGIPIDAAGARAAADPNAGLVPIPGAKWNGKPVFTDGSGGIYVPRGRGASVEAGLDFLGQAGPEGLKMGGARVRGPSGRLTFRDGQFFDGAGQRASVIDVPQPEQPAQVPGVPGTQGTSGLDNFLNSPFVQVPLERSLDQIDSSLAARGLLDSGRRIEAIGDRVADSLFAGGFLPFINTNLALAGAGQVGANTSSNAASAFSNQVGQSGVNLGNIALGEGSARRSSFEDIGGGLGSLFLLSDPFSNFSNPFRRSPDLTTLGGIMPNPPPGV